MFRAGHALVVATVGLLVYGVVMVSSAGLSIDADTAIDLRRLMLGRPAILAALSAVVLIAATFVPVDRIPSIRGLATPALWISLVSIGLLLAVHVPGIGREVNGARRWIAIGPIGFQPSEIAKWGMLVTIAWFGATHRDRLGSLVRGFLPPVLLLGTVCLLIGTEDLGTAILVGLVGVALLLAAGARALHAALLVPFGGAAVAALMIASPYRIDRIRAFLDPYADPQGVGYHMLQSMSAVSGGGLAGRGLGNSVQKFGYLPEDTNDFLFAIICEELGLVGAALAVFLYVLIITAGISIIRRCDHAFGRLLALGVTLTIGIQALINMLVVTGSAPTKGIALPLLSSGGTGWILTAFSIGLLVALDRAGKRTPVSRETCPLGLAGASESAA